MTFFAPDSLASSSEASLRTTFKLRVNGNPVQIATIGQAYQFLTTLSSAECMEFRALHNDAIDSLERAASIAMLAVRATIAVRALFVSAKLL